MPAYIKNLGAYMDVHTPHQRSFNMACIKSKDTKAELAVRSLLHRMGYRFRLHCNELPGSPDIVLPKYNTLIFVHGCYWHRHEGCRFATVPVTNAAKWQKKFQENIHRDKKNIEAVQQLGWQAVIVWECEIRTPETLADRLNHELKLRFSGE